MKTSIKIIIGIIGTLTIGFIGFQALKVEPPEIKVVYNTVKPEGRRITTFPFVGPPSEKATETQQEKTNVESPDREMTSIPENVPTTQSSDDEIREFQVWLSAILTEGDTLEEGQQEEVKTEDDEIDYDIEKSVIKSVIQEQWANSLETYDIQRYMSAIWEDDFFYVSDMGTPDNPNDDMIFRSGQQEREGTLRMFNATQNIKLNLSQNGDIEFLSDSLAMVDYDYDLRLNWTHREQSNPSGRMIFIMELRENEEWRILEWYDYATPDP